MTLRFGWEEGPNFPIGFRALLISKRYRFSKFPS